MSLPVTRARWAVRGLAPADAFDYRSGRQTGRPSGEHTGIKGFFWGLRKPKVPDHVFASFGDYRKPKVPDHGTSPAASLDARLYLLQFPTII